MGGWRRFAALSRTSLSSTIAVTANLESRHFIFDLVGGGDARTGSGLTAPSFRIRRLHSALRYVLLCVNSAW